MSETLANNKFKQGQWVIGNETAFKIDSIKVYGDHFGYSGESIDGYFSEEQLEKADSNLTFMLETISNRVKK
jgi:hypothetical protein